MKEKIFKVLKIMMIIFVVLPCVLIIGFILLIRANDFLWKGKEYKYYSNEENFMEVTSEINYVSWNHSEQYVVIRLSEVPEMFSDSHFKIEGDNFNKILENDGEKYLKEGTIVTIVTAPRYFGNGYAMPIVEIRVGDQELLNYQEGYEGFMKTYRIFKVIEIFRILF